MSVNSHARQFFVAFFFCAFSAELLSAAGVHFLFVVGCWLPSRHISSRVFFLSRPPSWKRWGTDESEGTSRVRLFDLRNWLHFSVVRNGARLSLDWIIVGQRWAQAHSTGGSQQQQKTIIKFGGVRLQGPRTFLCVCEPVNECTGRHKKALWTRLK